MSSDFNLMTLPFDQYTRNLLIKNLINSIRTTSNEALKILDVGGRAGNLRDFLPDDEIYVLDIRNGEEINYIVGNIASAPCKDASFDVVVSSDVYEHIPPGDRLNVIYEMLRISKNYVVLGAPFDSNEVVDAETKACNYFREIFGEPHSWLKEHMKNGLPSQKKLEEFLQSIGVDFLTLQTNNVSTWLLFELFDFYAYKYKIPAENRIEIFRYYNQNYLDLGDSLEPSYRKIYLFGKRGTLPKLDFKSNSKIDLAKYHTFQALIFEAVEKLTGSKDTHIHNLESIINENNKQIALQAEAIQNKDIHIHNLESIIDENNKQIALQAEAIQDKNTHIHKLESIMNENNRALNSMQSSTTWQLLTQYQHFVDRLLPASTKRRDVYDFGIVSLRILVKDGSKAFFSKISERYGQKHLDASNIPVVETSVNQPHELLPLAKNTLCCHFIVPVNNLNKIKIFTATYQRTNLDIEFQITDSNGHSLRKGKVNGYKVLDNDYTSFKFKPIKDSRGQIFFFKI